MQATFSAYPFEFPPVSCSCATHTTNSVLTEPSNERSKPKSSECGESSVT